VILRNVGWYPLFLLSADDDAAGLMVAVTAIGTGGAGFNGTVGIDDDTSSSRTVDEVVASNTGWLMCSLSLFTPAAADEDSGGRQGAGRMGVRDTACCCSLAITVDGCDNGLILNPLYLPDSSICRAVGF